MTAPHLSTREIEKVRKKRYRLRRGDMWRRIDDNGASEKRRIRDFVARQLADGQWFHALITVNVIVRDIWRLNCVSA